MYECTQKVIRNKVGLLNLAEELGNISKACKVMGLSRDTFYRYKSAVEEGGIEALLDKNRRRPNLKIESMMQQKKLLLGLLWNSQLIVSSVRATSSGSKEFLCLPAALDASG